MSATTAAILQILDCREQLRCHLANQVRIDGRGLTDHRPIDITPSPITADDVVGSTQVRIGGTIALCGINLMVGTPSLEKPKSGDIVGQVFLDAATTADSEQRGKSDLAYELENTLNAILKSDKLISLEQLCIVEGKAAYRLCVNVTCLSNAGNLLDVVLLAALQSLADTKVPEAIITEDKITVNSASVRALVLKGTFVPVTLGVFESNLLVDPSSKEEKVLQGTVTSVVSQTDSSLVYYCMTAGQDGSSEGQNQQESERIMSLSLQVAARLGHQIASMTAS